MRAWQAQCADAKYHDHRLDGRYIILYAHFDAQHFVIRWQSGFVASRSRSQYTGARSHPGKSYREDHVRQSGCPTLRQDDAIHPGAFRAADDRAQVLRILNSIQEDQEG